MSNNKKDLAKKIWRCERCREFGLKRDLEKGIVPLFLEGNPEASVWLVGLNPKIDEKKGIREPEIAADFNKYYESCTDFNFDHPYFTIFKQIFGKLDLKLGDEVLSNDLVKCGSADWSISNKNKIIANCSEWLWHQVNLLKPKFIVCNGIAVSKAFYEKYTRETFNPNDTQKTRIDITFDGNICTVFLSGFISQIDRIARIRLLNEIREVMSARALV